MGEIVGPPRCDGARSGRMIFDCYPTPDRPNSGGTLVCTTCGAVVGATEADQIRHTTWHTTLAELFTLASGR